MTAHVPGVVAVGVQRGPNQIGVVWSALDGFNWSRTPRHGPALDFGQMVDVTSTDAGLVAVGWLGTVGGLNSDAAVWTSIDGESWTRMFGDAEDLGSGVMLDVVPGGPGLVAVGTDGVNAAVWTAPVWRPAYVLGKYLDARNAGDVEAVLGFYADDAVVVSHPFDVDGLASGVDEIRLLEQQVPVIQGSVGGIQFREMRLSGTTVTFDYTFLNTEGTCFERSDNIVTFENGEITLHEWGVDDQSLCGSNGP